MSDTPEQIICLNYCMPDQQTGYCLTCGRPPLPVSAVDLSGRTFGAISIKGVSRAPDETPDPSDSRPAGQ